MVDQTDRGRFAVCSGHRNDWFPDPAQGQFQFGYDWKIQTIRQKGGNSMLANPWTENHHIGPGKIIRPMGTNTQLNALGLKFLDLWLSQGIGAYL
jgi:hypothetical protein